MAPVGGSGGWEGEKKLQKSPKNNMFFCFFHIWGVGGSEVNVEKSTFFFFFFEPFPYTPQVRNDMI